VTNIRTAGFWPQWATGRELRHKLACFGGVAGAGLPEVDFSKLDTIRNAVRAAAPAVIVNAAAYHGGGQS